MSDPTDVPAVDLDAEAAAALAAIGTADDVAALEDVRVRFLGKKSQLVVAQSQMRNLTPDGRKSQGQAINAFKQTFEQAFGAARERLASAELDARLRAEHLDLTMPPRRVPPGRPHLLTQVAEAITDVFVGLGYEVADGPEVESGTYCFDLMNIPADHPARKEMDTIYVAEGNDVVLRPHTSSVQARLMTTRTPPIAAVIPGRVYRQDTVDATHSPYFHQVEGLVIDRGITMAHLRGTLLAFAKAMFGPDREVRMRPSMFPFTEPSAEVDISWDGHGSNDGWLEILGAGMVDEAVLSACGIDPSVYSGFAFGVGIERVAMLRHGVTDIREFTEGDVRSLANF